MKYAFKQKKLVRPETHIFANPVTIVLHQSECCCKNPINIDKIKSIKLTPDVLVDGATYNVLQLFPANEEDGGPKNVYAVISLLIDPTVTVQVNGLDGIRYEIKLYNNHEFVGKFLNSFVLRPNVSYQPDVLDLTNKNNRCIVYYKDKKLTEFYQLYQIRTIIRPIPLSKGKDQTTIEFVTNNGKDMDNNGILALQYDGAAEVVYDEGISDEDVPVLCIS